MFAKLCTIIGVIGVTGVGMLVIRQQRLQAASELAASVQRAAGDDQALWRLRIRISQEITPAKVREMCAVIGPTKPIDTEWCAPQVWCEPGTEPGTAGGEVKTPARAAGARVPVSTAPAGRRDEPKSDEE